MYHHHQRQIRTTTPVVVNKTRKTPIRPSTSDSYALNSSMNIVATNSSYYGQGSMPAKNDEFELVKDLRRFFPEINDLTSKDLRNPEQKRCLQLLDQMVSSFHCDRIPINWNESTSNANNQKQFQSILNLLNSLLPFQVIKSVGNQSVLFNRSLIVGPGQMAQKQLPLESIDWCSLLFNVTSVKGSMMKLLRILCEWKANFIKIKKCLRSTTEELQRMDRAHHEKQQKLYDLRGKMVEFERKHYHMMEREKMIAERKERYHRLIEEHRANIEKIMQILTLWLDEDQQI
ncbi:neuropeptide FF receptor 2-like [Sarcoptes scabiei]|nr:neuropeptide FF receptor 2-like [Sarcoptes scabiei]